MADAGSFQRNAARGTAEHFQDATVGVKCILIVYCARKKRINFDIAFN